MRPDGISGQADLSVSVVSLPVWRIDMRDPENELRGYLEKLVHRYLNLVSLHRELRIINSWRSRPGVSAYELGAYFFALVGYSFWRTVLVELALLLSEKEDKSVLDWLKKAREHVARLRPSLYDASSNTQKPIKPSDYRAIIDGQLSEIQVLEDTIDRIQAHRDKSIAHLDRTYFNNPDKLYIDYALTYTDIGDLLALVERILRSHYECLLNADVDLEVASASTSDTLLRCAEAFLRARNDQDLIAKGFRPASYLVDDDERET